MDQRTVLVRSMQRFGGSIQPTDTIRSEKVTKLCQGVSSGGPAHAASGWDWRSGPGGISDPEAPSA